ncbi:regulatory protein UhpC [Actinobacillus equuli]|nr:regulatory protein UhpC [Actinobacillus equuli]
MCLLRDRPASMGLPTVGEWRNDIAEKNMKVTAWA